MQRARSSVPSCPTLRSEPAKDKGMMRRSKPGDRLRRGFVASGTALALLVAPMAAVSSAAVPPGIQHATTFLGTPTVGPLFPPGNSTHSCTASVITSSSGSLLVTAAHCLLGTGIGWTFAPGYHDGVSPNGAWTVIGAFVDPSWEIGTSASADLAVLRVARQKVHGTEKTLQQVVGSNNVGDAPSIGTKVSIAAYGFGSNDRPKTCTPKVKKSDGALAFDCTPYPGGTSGAPWLVSGKGHTTLVGTISGLHQGGCTPWRSYSVTFGPWVKAIVAAADAGLKPETLPKPPGDGC